MRRFATLISVLVLATVSLQAQTEVWRFPNRATKRIIPDGQGNAYVLQGWGRDTLRKLAPNGTTQWMFPIPSVASTDMAFNGSGIYLLQMDVVSQPGFDTLWYLDLSGVPAWSFKVPYNMILRERIVVDNQGNMIAMADSATSSSGMEIVSTKLIKIGKDGTLMFDVDLPASHDPVALGATLAWSGPFMNASGNFWMSGEANVTHNAQTPAATIEETDFIETIFLFDGNTGSVLMEKTIFTLPWIVQTKTQTGEIREKFLFFNLLPLAYVVSGDNLVVSGTLTTHDATVKKGRRRQTEKESWQVVIVAPDGQTKEFRYKGTGLSTYTINGDRYTEAPYNELQYVYAAENGALILSGVAGKGRSNNGRGNTYFQNVLMRVDPIRMRVVWKIVTREQDFDAYLYQPAQKIFHSRIGSSRANVYDMDGKMSVAALKFADSVNVAADFLQNTESGYYYIYLWHNEPGNQYNYVAKFALQGLLAGNTFRGIESTPEKIPSTVTLAQNYPNPFNPITDIEYEFDFGESELGDVSVKVYDILGKEVASLVHEVKEPGAYTVTWDATDKPSGVYFCRLAVSNLENGGETFVRVKRMVLLK